jgi:hypothetical protein
MRGQRAGSKRATKVMPMMALVMMALERWLRPAFLMPFLPPAPVWHAPADTLFVAYRAPARLAPIHPRAPPEQPDR